MAQFQTQVPHPLSDQLPCLLTRGRMADPAAGVLFLVFIGQRRFKGATMQVQCHNVGGGERLLRQAGEEEFIDHAGTRDTNRALLFAGWMGRDHHATLDAIRPHRHIRAVVERAHHSTLRVGQMLIGGQFQASLDLGSLQDLIVTATHHKRQPSQIGKDGSCAVLPIEAKKGTRIGMLVRFEVALDRCHCPTQLCPVFTIPRISISAEPLMGMGLQDRSASSHDFPALAPGVAAFTGRFFIRPLWKLEECPGSCPCFSPSFSCPCLCSLKPGLSVSCLGEGLSAKVPG